MAISDGSTRKTESIQKQPKSLLLVEDDASQHQLLAKGLSKCFPYLRVTTVRDGDTAWAQIEDKPVDIVVLDWRLSGGLQGSGLLNRLRSENSPYGGIPVLVLSAGLQKEDLALVSEFFLVSAMAKPYRLKEVEATVQQLFDESSEYTERIKMLIERLENYVSSENEGPDDLIKHCRTQSRVSVSLTYALRFLRKNGFHKKSMRLIERCQSMGAKSIGLITEMAKGFLLDGQTDRAMELLRLAQNRSPNNLDRLILSGEENLKHIKPDEATTDFENARRIDHSHPRVQKGLVMAKSMRDFVNLNPAEELPKSFAGMLNAIGVGMARTGKFEKGIEHYNLAMDYVDDKTDQAKLAFNCGLAHLRGHQPEKGLSWFYKALGLEPGYIKAKNIIDKVCRDDPSLALGSEQLSQQEVNLEGDLEDFFDGDLSLSLDEAFHVEEES